MQAKSEPTKVTLPFDRLSERQYYEVEVGPQNNLSNKSPATYNMNFNQPILKNPKDYYVAINKFSIPSNLIPVFIPDMASGSTTNTIYSLTLTYNGGTSGQTTVVYTPENRYSTDSEFYYYIYDFTWFCTLLNTALSTAFGNLPSKPVGLPDAPYFQYDSTTNLISFVCQIAFYDNQLEHPIEVYVNEPLAVLLTGINMISNPNGKGIPDSSGQDAKIIINNQYNNWYNPPWTTVSTPPLYYIFTQQYVSLVAFTPLASLRVTSNSLPINRENILSSNQSNVLSASPIVQSFYPIYNTGSDVRSFLIVYTAQLYHLIPMYGDLDIGSLQITVEWVDQKGIPHNLYLSYNSVMLIELVFIKKNTFTS